MKQSRFSLTGSIGSTPLVELTRLNPNPRVRILAKLEGSNTGGSVKDRPALYMLTKAEEAGELSSSKTILEPTSGNTGIAIAMLGAAKGYRVKLVMPACVSLERRAVLEAYGAEVVLSPAEEATDGAIRLAHRILEEHPDDYYMPNQYANPNNPLAHYKTTGPEIWRQTEGRVDAFVASVGTGGTLAGVAIALKERKPAVRIVLADPAGSALYHYYAHGELKAEGESITEGIGQGRITANLEGAIVDEAFQIPDSEAIPIAFDLLQHEGLCMGGSTGVNVAGAIRMAKALGPGHTIVTILCDYGTRYASKLFNPAFLREKNLPVPAWLEAVPEVPDVTEEVPA